MIELYTAWSVLLLDIFFIFLRFCLFFVKWKILFYFICRWFGQAITSNKYSFGFVVAIFFFLFQRYSLVFWCRNVVFIEDFALENREILTFFAFILFMYWIVHLKFQKILLRRETIPHQSSHFSSFIISLEGVFEYHYNYDRVRTCLILWIVAFEIKRSWISFYFYFVLPFLNSHKVNIALGWNFAGKSRVSVPYSNVCICLF